MYQDLNPKKEKDYSRITYRDIFIPNGFQDGSRRQGSESPGA